MEVDSGIPFSSGYSLKRSGDVELRGGKLYKGCDCIKRNGLQMDCRRTECLGRSCCSSMAPSCNPGNSARRMANYVMGVGARGSGYSNNYNQYQDMGSSSMSGYPNSQDYNMRELSAQYTMDGIGDGNYTQSAGSDMMNYNTNYGGPPDLSSQFMPRPQVAPYGACMPSNEAAGLGQYSDYGPSSMEPQGMQYGDYVQG